MTLAALRKLAAKIGGAEIEVGDFDVEALAPQGKRFTCYQVHMLRMPINRGGRRAEIYDEMAADLRYGLEPCEDPECDYCTEEA